MYVYNGYIFHFINEVTLCLLTKFEVCFVGCEYSESLLKDFISLKYLFLSFHFQIVFYLCQGGMFTAGSKYLGLVF